MELLESLKNRWPKILKIAAIILAAIVLLALFINLVIGPIFSRFGNTVVGQKNFSLQTYAPYATDNAYSKDDGSLGLSIRNAYGETAVAGNISAQDYEVMQYNATIETGKLQKDCALIAGLKSKDYIIFENSNIGEHNCNFSFKIEKDNVEEALALIKSLDPRDLSQNISTIKKEVEDFTSQEEILKNKQASIDETLKNAIAAYDEITDLAKRTNDADSLARIIDSKIGILEKLTAQRLQISADLENLSRQKAEQLDRLKYVNFYVYIYENKIFDWRSLKDSWITSAKQFVQDINQTVKDLSLGLVVVLLYAFKFILYIFLALVAVKVCWKLGKNIWKK
jgi:hypothetical protein